MTLRQDMIQTLKRAPKLLDSSTDLVKKYISGRLGEDGGFLGRDNKSDLYYTVFGIELLIALDCPVAVKKIQSYLASFNEVRELDLVHLAGLTRCYANLAEISSNSIDLDISRKLTECLSALQCKDGAFSTNTPDKHGNAYGCFLAIAMCQDLGISVLDKDAIIKCLDALKMDNGGYANEVTGKIAATPSTAAALCCYYMLELPLPEKSVEWLLKQVHNLGGFCALSGIGPMSIPDLLSTATALQALSYSSISDTEHREKHLDFLDSLWSHKGGFSGSWADSTVDCEYTYYGLLTLGYLENI